MSLRARQRLLTPGFRAPVTFWHAPCVPLVYLRGTFSHWSLGQPSLQIERVPLALFPSSLRIPSRAPGSCSSRTIYSCNRTTATKLLTPPSCTCRVHTPSASCNPPMSQASKPKSRESHKEMVTQQGQETRSPDCLSRLCPLNLHCLPGNSHRSSRIHTLGKESSKPSQLPSQRCSENVLRQCV